MEQTELPVGFTKTAEAAPTIKTLAQVEKDHIFHTLDIFQGNKTKAAQALGVSLKTLYNKLHTYGVMRSKSDAQGG